jgi:ankyrin repeat protein
LLLPLAFGAGFVPWSSVGWASADDSPLAPAQIIHAAAGSELLLVDTDQLQKAVASGAVAPSQLFELLANNPQRAAKLVKEQPHCVNIRDTGTGDTVLHLCAHNGNLTGLRWLLGSGATYTPVCNGIGGNVDGVTALHTAIKHQYRDCVKELWQHVTPVLNETTARLLQRDYSETTALLASKRTTAISCCHFCRTLPHPLRGS